MDVKEWRLEVLMGCGGWVDVIQEFWPVTGLLSKSKIKVKVFFDGLFYCSEFFCSVFCELFGIYRGVL
jgi:hypothetical protein